MFDVDETDEENDTLGELTQSGSRGQPLNAGSLYIHGVNELDDSEAVEVCDIPINSRSHLICPEFRTCLTLAMGCPCCIGLWAWPQRGTSRSRVCH